MKIDKPKEQQTEQERNKKPRVIFPFTEAGLGHIMPLIALADKFEELYGDRVEVVRSSFFSESGDEGLKAFEEMLCNTVVRANKNTLFGFFMTFNMDLWGVQIATGATMRHCKAGTRKAGILHMAELKPDLVVSTHWATNYYAEHLDPKPLTAMYCPDAEMNPLFCYDCDLAMVSTDTGYEAARKKYAHRFNEKNLRRVPYIIRNEAFDLPRDKKELRRRLGIPEDKFTVLLAEGGYGIGRMEEICEVVLARDLPVTLIPVCGKNVELYEKLRTMKSRGKTTFVPVSFTDRMLEYEAASDLFCGKSGANVIAEACFFGVPQIVTHYATNIEQHIGEYYVETVGSALKIFDAAKTVDQIEEFLNDPAKLEPLRLAAESQRGNYGTEKSVKLLFELLAEKFPSIRREGDERPSEK